MDVMSEGRVLVVDDEAEVRRSVRLILSKAGYDVVEAEDGEAGVNALRSGDNPIAVDAIICDLDMPKMSGIEAIPNFLYRFPSCPIIVLSGSGKLESATRLFQPGILFKQGVVEFLSKPIDQELLLGAVKKAVNEGGRRDKFAT
jgi:two-component system chemotaxis response regulator CheY